MGRSHPSHQRLFRVQQHLTCLLLPLFSPFTDCAFSPSSPCTIRAGTSYLIGPDEIDFQSHGFSKKKKNLQCPPSHGNLPFHSINTPARTVIFNNRASRMQRSWNHSVSRRGGLTKGDFFDDIQVSTNACAKQQIKCGRFTRWSQ